PSAPSRRSIGGRPSFRWMSLAPRSTARERRASKSIGGSSGIGNPALGLENGGLIWPAMPLVRRLPQPWRVIVDWVVTITVAVVLVLVFEAKVAKPYRIPSSSMEPTLHCARPAAWCLGGSDDRVIANRLAYDVGDPKRGQIVVFNAPPAASQCGNSEGEVFIKRLIGLPGEVVSEQDGFIRIDGRPLSEPYVKAAFRDHETR